MFCIWAAVEMVELQKRKSLIIWFHVIMSTDSAILIYCVICIEVYLCFNSCVPSTDPISLSPWGVQEIFYLCLSSLYKFSPCQLCSWHKFSLQWFSYYPWTVCPALCFWFDATKLVFCIFTPWPTFSIGSPTWYAEVFSERGGRRGYCLHGKVTVQFKYSWSR